MPQPVHGEHPDELQAVSQLGSVRPRAAAASDDFDAAAPSRAAISA